MQKVLEMMNVDLFVEMFYMMNNLNNQISVTDNYRFSTQAFLHAIFIENGVFLYAHN